MQRSRRWLFWTWLVVVALSGCNEEPTSSGDPTQAGEGCELEEPPHIRERREARAASASSMGEGSDVEEPAAHPQAPMQAPGMGQVEFDMGELVTTLETRTEWPAVIQFTTKRRDDVPLTSCGENHLARDLEGNNQMAIQWDGQLLGGKCVIRTPVQLGVLFLYPQMTHLRMASHTRPLSTEDQRNLGRFVERFIEVHPDSVAPRSNAAGWATLRYQGESTVVGVDGFTKITTINTTWSVSEGKASIQFMALSHPEMTRLRACDELTLGERTWAVEDRGGEGGLRKRFAGPVQDLAGAADSLSMCGVALPLSSEQARVVRFIAAKATPPG